MSEKNNSSLCGCFGIGGAGTNTDKSTCINVDKIYDSARDKDCIEDLRVFVDQNGQSAIDHATNLRCKCADVIWANISVSDVAFNRGYYAVDIRFYFRICFEATIPYAPAQEFCGIAVYDKQVIMFGSEGNVGIFTSDFCNNNMPGVAARRLQHQSSQGGFGGCHSHLPFGKTCGQNLPLRRMLLLAESGPGKRLQCLRRGSVR